MKRQITRTVLVLLFLCGAYLVHRRSITCQTRECVESLRERTQEELDYLFVSANRAYWSTNRQVAIWALESFVNRLDQRFKDGSFGGTYAKEQHQWGNVYTHTRLAKLYLDAGLTNSAYAHAQSVLAFSTAYDPTGKTSQQMLNDVLLPLDAIDSTYHETYEQEHNAMLQRIDELTNR